MDEIERKVVFPATMVPPPPPPLSERWKGEMVLQELPTVPTVHQNHKKPTTFFFYLWLGNHSGPIGGSLRLQIRIILFYYIQTGVGQKITPPTPTPRLL